MRRWLIGVSLFLAFGGTAAQAAGCDTDTRINWRVSGGFTLFNTSEASRDASDSLLDDLAATRKGSGPVSMTDAYNVTIRHLASRSSTGPALFKTTFYDRATEAYRSRIGQEDFLAPDHRWIRISAPSQTGDCVWRIPGQTPIARGCSAEVVARVPATAPTVVVVDLPDGSKASACIKIRDTLILAFGDSFAAGEGNPDRPANWASLQHPTKKIDQGFRWIRSKQLLPQEASAAWWDDTCHRSLLSQHAQAALSLAAENRQATVTFISFACSGATILDGYIAPRISTPGGARTMAAINRGERDSRAYQTSQINQAVDLLCADDRVQYELLPIPEGLRYWKQLNKLTTLEADRQTRHQVAVRRCSEWRRRPDIVLNALGGNDVGFAGVAAWGVLPPAGVRHISGMFVLNGVAEKSRNPGMGLVCPIHIRLQLRCASPLGTPSFTAEQLVAEDLGVLLTLSAKAFDRSGLGGAAYARVQSLYPSILRDADGARCGQEWTREFRNEDARWGDDTNLMKQREPWMAQAAKIPFVALTGWSFGMADLAGQPDCLAGDVAFIQMRETCVMEQRVWAPLNHKIQTTVEQQGWKTVAMDEITRTHGVCAWSRKSEGWEAYRAEFGFPRWTGRDWAAEYPKPWEWNPYSRSESGRWFRTANDSALTQYSAGQGGADEAVSGTIHPTAAAHAAMADLITAELHHQGLGGV